jgi:hypothetical protein
MESSNVLIQLDPLDNVLIARCTLKEGYRVVISGRHFILNQSLGLGFKIAIQNIKKGDKIIKCGIPIGSASLDIEMGEPVHTHNLKSDFVPTYTLQKPK